jgi:hypothetical protein
MKNQSWYHARLRWGVMHEEVGLIEWKEAVHIFLSEDWDAAFQQALEIGRIHETVEVQESLEVDTRLAEITELHELSGPPFEVRLNPDKPGQQLPFEHRFQPEQSCPMNPF